MWVSSIRRGLTNTVTLLLVGSFLADPSLGAIAAVSAHPRPLAASQTPLFHSQALQQPDCWSLRVLAAKRYMRMARSGVAKASLVHVASKIEQRYGIRKERTITAVGWAYETLQFTAMAFGLQLIGVQAFLESAGIPGWLAPALIRMVFVDVAYHLVTGVNRWQMSRAEREDGVWEEGSELVPLPVTRTNWASVTAQLAFMSLVWSAGRSLAEAALPGLGMVGEAIAHLATQYGGIGLSTVAGAAGSRNTTGSLGSLPETDFKREMAERAVYKNLDTISSEQKNYGLYQLGDPAILDEVGSLMLEVIGNKIGEIDLNEKKDYVIFAVGGYGVPNGNLLLARHLSERMGIPYQPIRKLGMEANHKLLLDASECKNKKIIWIDQSVHSGSTFIGSERQLRVFGATDVQPFFVASAPTLTGSQLNAYVRMAGNDDAVLQEILNSGAPITTAMLRAIYLRGTDQGPFVKDFLKPLKLEARWNIFLSSIEFFHRTGSMPTAFNLVVDSLFSSSEQDLLPYRKNIERIAYEVRQLVADNIRTDDGQGNFFGIHQQLFHDIVQTALVRQNYHASVGGAGSVIHDVTELLFPLDEVRETRAVLRLRLRGMAVANEPLKERYTLFQIGDVDEIERISHDMAEQIKAQLNWETLGPVERRQHVIATIGGYGVPMGASLVAERVNELLGLESAVSPIKHVAPKVDIKKRAPANDLGLYLNPQHEFANKKVIVISHGLMSGDRMGRVTKLIQNVGGAQAVESFYGASLEGFGMGTLNYGDIVKPDIPTMVRVLNDPRSVVTTGMLEAAIRRWTVGGQGPQQFQELLRQLKPEVKLKLMLSSIEYFHAVGTPYGFDQLCRDVRQNYPQIPEHFDRDLSGLMQQYYDYVNRHPDRPESGPHYKFFANVAGVLREKKYRIQPEGANEVIDKVLKLFERTRAPPDLGLVEATLGTDHFSVLHHPSQGPALPLHERFDELWNEYLKAHEEFTRGDPAEGFRRQMDVVERYYKIGLMALGKEVTGVGRQKYENDYVVALHAFHRVKQLRVATETAYREAVRGLVTAPPENIDLGLPAKVPAEIQNVDNLHREAFISLMKQLDSKGPENLAVAVIQNFQYDLGLPLDLFAWGTTFTGRPSDELFQIICALRAVVYFENTESVQVSSFIRSRSALFLSKLCNLYFYEGAAGADIDHGGGVTVPASVHELSLKGKKLENLLEAEQQTMLRFSLKANYPTLHGHSVTALAWLTGLYESIAKQYQQRSVLEALNLELAKRRPRLFKGNRILENLEVEKATCEQMVDAYKENFPVARQEFRSAWRMPPRYVGGVIESPMRGELTSGAFADASFLSSNMPWLLKILQTSELLDRHDGSIGNSLSVGFEIVDRSKLPQGVKVKVHSLDVGFDEDSKTGDDVLRKRDSSLVLDTLVSIGLFPKPILEVSRKEGKSDEEILNLLLDHTFGPGKGLKIDMHIQKIVKGSGLATSNLIAVATALAMMRILEPEETQGQQRETLPMQESEPAIRVSVPGEVEIVKEGEKGYVDLKICRGNECRTPSSEIVDGHVDVEMPMSSLMGDGDYTVHRRRVTYRFDDDGKIKVTEPDRWESCGQFNISEGKLVSKEGSVATAAGDIEWEYLDDIEGYIKPAILVSQITQYKQGNLAGTQDDAGAAAGGFRLIWGSKALTEENGKVAFAGGIVPDIQAVAVPQGTIEEFNKSFSICRVGLSDAAENTLVQNLVAHLLNLNVDAAANWNQQVARATAYLREGNLDGLANLMFAAIALRQKMAPVAISPAVSNSIDRIIKKYGALGVRIAITGARSTGSLFIYVPTRLGEARQSEIHAEIRQVLTEEIEKLGKLVPVEEKPRIYHSRIAMRGARMRLMTAKQMKDREERVVKPYAAYEQRHREERRIAQALRTPDEVTEYEQITGVANAPEPESMKRQGSIVMDPLVEAELEKPGNEKSVEEIAESILARDYRNFKAPGANPYVRAEVHLRLANFENKLRDAKLDVEESRVLYHGIAGGVVDPMLPLNAKEIKEIAHILAYGRAQDDTKYASSDACDEAARKLQEKYHVQKQEFDSLMHDLEERYAAEPKDGIALDDVRLTYGGTEMTFREAREKEIEKLTEELSRMSNTTHQEKLRYHRKERLLIALRHRPHPQFLSYDHFLFIESETYHAAFMADLRRYREAMAVGAISVMFLVGGLGGRMASGAPKNVFRFPHGHEVDGFYLRLAFRRFSRWMLRMAITKPTVLNLLTSAFTEKAILAVVRPLCEEAGVDAGMVSLVMQGLNPVVFANRNDFARLERIEGQPTEQLHQEQIREFKRREEVGRLALSLLQAQLQGQAVPQEEIDQYQRAKFNRPGLDPLNIYVPNGTAGLVAVVERGDITVKQLEEAGYQLNRSRLALVPEKEQKGGMPFAKAVLCLADPKAQSVLTIMNGSSRAAIGGADLLMARAISSIWGKDDNPEHSEVFAVSQYANVAGGRDTGGVQMVDRASETVDSIEGSKLQGAQGLIYQNDHTAMNTNVMFLNSKLLWHLLSPKALNQGNAHQSEPGYEKPEHYLASTEEQRSRLMQQRMNHDWPKVFTHRVRVEEKGGDTHRWSVIGGETVFARLLGFLQHKTRFGRDSVQYHEVIARGAFKDDKTTTEQERMERPEHSGANPKVTPLKESQPEFRTIDEIVRVYQPWVDFYAERQLYSESQKMLDRAMAESTRCGLLDIDGNKAYLLANLMENYPNLDEEFALPLTVRPIGSLARAIETEVGDFVTDFARDKDGKRNNERIQLANDDNADRDLGQRLSLIKMRLERTDGLKSEIQVLLKMQLSQLIFSNKTSHEDPTIESIMRDLVRFPYEKRSLLLQDVLRKHLGSTFLQSRHENVLKNLVVLLGHYREVDFLYSEWLAQFDDIAEEMMERRGILAGLRITPHKIVALVDKDATLGKPGEALQIEDAAKILRHTMEGMDITVLTGASALQGWDHLCMPAILAATEDMDVPEVMKRVAFERLRVQANDGSTLVKVDFEERSRTFVAHPAEHIKLVDPETMIESDLKTMHRTRKNPETQETEEDKSQRRMLWETSIKAFMLQLFEESGFLEDLAKELNRQRKRPFSSLSELRTNVQSYIQALALPEDYLPNMDEKKDEFFNVFEPMLHSFRAMVNNEQDKGTGEQLWRNVFNEIMKEQYVGQVIQKVNDKERKPAFTASEKILIPLLGVYYKESHWVFGSISADKTLEDWSKNDRRMTAIRGMFIDKKEFWMAVEGRMRDILKFEDTRLGEIAKQLRDQDENALAISLRSGFGYINVTVGGASKIMRIRAAAQNPLNKRKVILKMGDSVTDLKPLPFTSEVRVKSERLPFKVATIKAALKNKAKTNPEIVNQFRFGGKDQTNAHHLIYEGMMTEADRDILLDLSHEDPWKSAIQSLFAQSHKAHNERMMLSVLLNNPTELHANEIDRMQRAGLMRTSYMRSAMDPTGDSFEIEWWGPVVSQIVFANLDGAARQGRIYNIDRGGMQRATRSFTRDMIEASNRQLHVHGRLLPMDEHNWVDEESDISAAAAADVPFWRKFALTDSDRNPNALVWIGFFETLFTWSAGLLLYGFMPHEVAGSLWEGFVSAVAWTLPYALLQITFAAWLHNRFGAHGWVNGQAANIRDPKALRGAVWVYAAGILGVPISLLGMLAGVTTMTGLALIVAGFAVSNIHTLINWFKKYKAAKIDARQTNHESFRHDLERLAHAV